MTSSSKSATRRRRKPTPSDAPSTAVHPDGGALASEIETSGQALIPAVASDVADVPALSHLTQAEATFVYNVEVLGLPVKKAADLAGLGMHLAMRTHVAEARKITRREVQGQAQFTREDVLAGVHDAIGRARLLAEPSTEIKGWEVIARLLGLEEAKKIDINLRESVAATQSGLSRLTDEQLMQLVPESRLIIDAEFYEVKP